ncbi:MAG: molybdopterin-dependent oxidoreductase, partial [Candidatus Tectomicrobia bacterium]|nr:molybdopterin-dependent oxidoreductase [Candidatus Tectomicrobia bacterium]
PVAMQEALARAADLLNSCDPAAVAVLAAPQGTNEDCRLLARLTTEVLAGCRVVVTTGEPGDEDDFLLRADKNPNTRGARDMGLPPPASVGDLTQLATAIEAGDIEVLLAVDVDLKATLGEETFTRLASKLRGLIALGSTMHGGYETAEVLLPSAAYVERHGTFTNFQGRIQRFQAAYTPQGAAQPAWRIYRRLANLLGADWNYPNHEAVWADIADAVPGYGVDYAELGDQGCLTSSED